MATVAIAGGVFASPLLTADATAQNAFARAGQNTHQAATGHPQVRPSDTRASAPATQTAPATMRTQPAGWNLRWRKSSRLTPQPVHVPRQDVFANKPIQTSSQSQAVKQGQPASQRQTTLQIRPMPQQTAPTVATANWRKPIGATPQSSHPNSVRTVGYDLPANTSAPNAGAATGNNAIPARARSQADEFFRNPFADESIAKANIGDRTSPNAKANAGGATLQQPGPVPTPARLTNQQDINLDGLFNEIPAPVQQSPPNALRGSGNVESAAPAGNAASDSAGAMQLPLGDAPMPFPEPQSGAQTTPPGSETPALPNPNEGGQPSLGDVLRQSGADASLSGPQSQPDLSEQDPVAADGDSDSPPNAEANPPQDRSQDSPSDRGLFDDSPFGNNADRADRDRLNQEADTAKEGEGTDDVSANVGMLSSNLLSCDDFRNRIAEETIEKLTLDISPPFRPDIFDPKKYAEEREKFEQQQESRPWYSVDGRPLGTGRLVDLKYEQVVIESEYGARETIQIADLSEGDLGYLSETWGLPKECRVEQVAFTPRAWTPATITWKASNLCHKPKYFEEVNLERYGHTAGPVLQPVVSSAHFFANIAVLPYKMGVHAPNECQYALGYYRPGDCAPWIVPPVPISAKGALAQGAAMSGLFWLIP